MDISVNTSKVKDTKDATSVTDILLIKASGYFNIFEWGKELLNDLDTMYEGMCMANERDKHCT